MVDVEQGVRRSGARTAARGWAAVVTAAMVALVVVVPAPSPADAAPVPAGFSSTTVISGLNLPSAVAFAPDGRVFVAEKGGVIRAYPSLGSGPGTVFKDLSRRVFNNWDRGLLGLAVDPRLGDGSGHDFVYALYAKDAPPGRTPPVWNDVCPTPPGGETDGCVVVGTLSRIPVLSNGTGGNEQILIDDEWCQQFTSHSVGGLAFGPDGLLYVSGGEGASWANADWGQFGGSLPNSPTPVNPCGDPPGRVGVPNALPDGRGGAMRSQSPRRPAGEPRLLSGTVLRVDPDTGNGVPGNPLYTAGSPGSNASRILAYGMRNPFRFDLRPGTGEVWVGDVGQSTWEEINRIPANPSTAPNFGWPCLEGPDQRYGYRDLNMCNALYADTTNPATAPWYRYEHDLPINGNDSCGTAVGSSVSGLTFYEGGNYPASYDGALFVADNSRNCIWVMRAGSNGLPDPSTATTFIDDADNPYPVDLATDPATGDLVYVNIALGTVNRISYDAPSGPVNTTAPSISGTLEVGRSLTGNVGSWSGTAPITHARQWQRCSTSSAGSCSDIAGATGSTYTPVAADGGLRLRLRVTATNSGGSATAHSAITSPVAGGNAAPQPVIHTPLASLRWSAGDQISFSGSATDPEDGTLAAGRLSWQMVTGHCSSTGCHTHALDARNGVRSGTFSAEEHQAPSFIEITLTATDSAGRSATAVRRIDPVAVDLTFRTDPPGLQLNAGDEGGATPFTQSWVANSQVQMDVPAQQSSGGTTHYFTGWSHGGARTQVVRAPTTNTSYTATYRAGPNPFGRAELIESPRAGEVRVRGWTVDPDALGSSTQVHIHVGGTSSTPGAERQVVSANRPRADVGDLHPSYGTAHGFDAAWTTARRGPQQVCAYAVNLGPGTNTLLGCSTVTIRKPEPFGHYERVRSTRPGEVHLRGWAADLSAPTTPVTMQVVIGGTRGAPGTESHMLLANRRRTDLARSHPHLGPDHGFDHAITTDRSGEQTVCVYAKNISIGSDTLLGCKEVDIVK